MIKEEKHHLRGHRVDVLKPEKIKDIAESVISILRIKRSTLKNMDAFIDKLVDEYSIGLDILDDREWLGIADALCDPARFTIAMPERLYLKITEDKDLPSIHILFHELGHLLLGHKPVLHHSDIEPIKHEDSEWQADVFADTILELLGEHMHQQLTLF